MMSPYWSRNSRAADRRRRDRVEESVARNRRAQAELLILVESIRGQVASLNREIEIYLDLDARGERERAAER